MQFGVDWSVWDGEVTGELVGGRPTPVLIVGATFKAALLFALILRASSFAAFAAFAGFAIVMIFLQ